MGWRIWIDTGGTFTDGVAVAPDGSSHRVKILSTSALRGSIVRRLDPQRFEVRESWSACAGLIDGFRFRLLRGGGDSDVVVGGFDPRTGLLTLDADRSDVEALSFVFSNL